MFVCFDCSVTTEIKAWTWTEKDTSGLRENHDNIVRGSILRESEIIKHLSGPEPYWIDLHTTAMKPHMYFAIRYRAINASVWIVDITKLIESNDFKDRSRHELSLGKLSEDTFGLPCWISSIQRSNRISWKVCQEMRKQGPISVISIRCWSIIIFFN